jgi:Terminase large subunit, T4likevirus-type, N-terminal/Terminase RNaseH-like domain
MAKSNKQQGGYNGNILLPLPEDQIALSAEELSEYVKCSQDPQYFIENYVKIVHVDEGIVKFALYPFQKELIDTFENNRFVICKLARQSGKSTVVVCGYFLWYILFHTEVSVGILANKETTAIELLRRLKQSFELLPRFLKQGVVKWDQKLIYLANNSRVRAESTSASAVRGDSFNIILLDEFAFVAENIATEFMTSVYPTITSGKTTKLFIVSTPAGYNLFYKIWNDATEGRNSYKTIGFTWRDVPGRTALNEKGENIWEKETRQNIGEMQFEQEFECSFMGSANTLIPAWKLKQLSYKEPVEVQGDFRIYKKPVRSDGEADAHIYLITCDIGQGQGLDSSVINVTDISVNPFVQVAVWRNNTLTPTLLAPMIRDIGLYYNSAYVFIEINMEGHAVADMLHNDLEYPNVLKVLPHPKKGQQLTGGFGANCRNGLKVTEATKRIGCSGLKTLIEKDKYVINDYQTLRELTTYVVHNTSYAAEEGNTDDCVATLVLVGWLTLQMGFENYVGLSMRKLLMEKHEPVSLELGAIGIMGDLERPSVIGQTAGGVEIVEDHDFWRNDDVARDFWG